MTVRRNERGITYLELIATATNKVGSNSLVQNRADAAGITMTPTHSNVPSA